MGDESKTPILLASGGSLVGGSVVVVLVAPLLAKLCKETTVATYNAAYLTLQNTCQSLYSQIPANETDTLFIVNATCLNSLSNFQQIKNSAIQTCNTMEYSFYFVGSIIGIIGLITIIINLIRR